MTQPESQPGPGVAADADRQVRLLAGAAQVNEATQPVAAGQGFSLRKGEARDILNQAYGIRDQLEDLKRQAASLQKLTPPAQDQASATYNQKLTRGAMTGFMVWDAAAAFDAGVDQVGTELTYMNTMIEKLEKALGITGEVEQQNKDAVNKAGSGQESIVS
ncbi:hypothetical protein [Amycolatopsis sp. H20-H5]|uniref:hypothetical protein n=1 Tax=Amycolatopsis sp. H20-H5 TaxID=3046309 RepID=UPI002DBB21E1|nr:hypothetical protein [Amycolatopsis sp. H20-H5]MEC3974294.1 hypothetical protein [Amycolatopsis sp. H20-H5]